MTKPGRNDPCPCGSGKKYKHCCLAAKTARDDDPRELVWRRLRRLKDDGGYATMMLRFVRDAYGEGTLDEAWNEFMLREEGPFDRNSVHLPVFMPWLFCLWAPDPEETGVADAGLHEVPPARALLQRKGHGLDPLLREYMESCLAAPLSFYEVLHGEPGRRLRLRDVIIGEEHEVMERSASRTMRTGDLLFGQVASARGVNLLEACGPVAIRPGDKIEVIELRRRMERGPEIAPREKLREYDLELRELYLDLADRVLHPRMPELRNTDDEKMVLQRLVFDIESAQETFDALKDLDFEFASGEAPEEAERDADGRLCGATVTWKKRGNDKHKSWDNTVLGRIRIDGRRMTAEVNSRERAERLREIVEKRLGAKARYRCSEIQSVERLLAEAEEAPEPRETAADRALRESPEAKSLASEFMARHYESWVEEAIPALGGRTPLEAVKDAEGREMVEALVRDAERRNRNMEPPVDEAVFRRLRERLGLGPNG